MELIGNNDTRLNDAIKLHIDTYGHLYSDYALEYILDASKNDLKFEDKGDIMRQIYASIGALPDEINLYKGLLEIIKNNFRIDKNIIEVAGGCYPILSKYIDDEQQQIGKGTITVYDPQLVTNKLGNIKLMREDFTMSTPIDGCDLFMSFAPCEVTECFIKKATQAKKEFIVALCGCVPSNQGNYGYYQFPESWYGEIYNLAEKSIDDNFELSVSYFDSNYGYDYPIISSTLKK